MKAIRRILFAIRNPEARQQPGLAKAIQIARAFDATLELFHALNDPVFILLAQIGDNTVDQLRERLESEARIPLLRLCEVARRHGVNAEHSVEWDYPPHEAIVRRATASGADLIVAEFHRGGRGRNWPIHLTDWELLRTSPMPVLLLRSPKPYRHPLTLAAVDPGHLHAKPLELDAHIVATAREFSKALRGTLHLLHASHPSVFALALGDPSVNATAMSFTYEDLKKKASESFEEFRAGADVPRTRAHLVDGTPALVIPRMARELGAGILVMGAVSRSGLKRVFIGNTAERILESLPCDVLVIKPEDFISRVARDSRGIRVVAPATLAPMLS